MYRLLKENLENYKKINNYEENKDEYRMRIVQDIEILVDIEKYKRLKFINHEIVKRVENLIYEINKKKEEHKFDLLAYELWGYGYEACELNDVDKEVVDEQIKLVELFASNVYWF